jgi:outer membrane protein OmpU
MKTIMKTLFVSIASLSMMFSVNAGELGVSGTAKATYHMLSGGNADNTIGVTNELNFTASGEMDNGYAWTYSMELDPSTAGTASSTTTPPSGSAINDDTQIAVTLNDMGTVKFCVSECGNGKEYAFDQSAYVALTDTGFSEGMNYPISASSYASMQYHTPELPFGTKATFAYGQSKNDGQSGNSSTGNGDSIAAYSLVTKPIDGLTLSASYYEIEDLADGITTEEQLQEGGAWGATYAAGNFTVGYGKSYLAPETTTATRALGAATVEYYENTGASIGFAVNDALSLSYSMEDGEANYQTSSTTAYDIEMKSIQAAYSLGGATLSVAHAAYDNVNYTNGLDAAETIIALNFAF